MKQTLVSRNTNNSKTIDNVKNISSEKREEVQNEYENSVTSHAMYTNLQIHIHHISQRPKSQGGWRKDYSEHGNHSEYGKGW
jgi:hypothetical protein